MSGTDGGDEVQEQVEELGALDGWIEDVEPPAFPLPLSRGREGLAGVVGENIRYEAARYELSQEDLARLVGKSRAAISLRYTGKVAWTLTEVGQIALAMGITPADLVTRARGPGGRGTGPW